MPKRKREAPGEDPHKDVEAKIFHAKKILNRAMKLARTFERQKMDKRIRMAEKEDEKKKQRLNQETKALQSLDVSKVVDSHLYKTLLKTKSIAESNLLPQDVVPPKRDASLSEDQVLAYDNVTARMYNTKPVKECMSEIMSTMYATIGIPNPATKAKSEKKSKKVAFEGTERDDAPSNSNVKAAGAPAGLSTPEEINQPDLAWDGFDSGSEADTELDEDDLAGYSARIVGSSDEDSEDEIEGSAFDPRQARSINDVKTLDSRDLSITPSPTPSRSPSPPVKISKPKTVAPQSAKASAFLPTLMGGYWSGTESSASDDERRPAAPAPRKNRRGQQARRLIAEKKYGGGAKHIKQGLPIADTTGRRKREEREAERKGARGKDRRDGGRDDGWDAKRGATGGGRAGFKRSRDMVTGENAAPLGDRKKIKHRDDVGELHASWAAAKKAKDAKVNAKFEGKKIVFD